MAHRTGSDRVSQRLSARVVQPSVLVLAAAAALLAAGIETYVWTVAYPIFALLDAQTFGPVHALHVERITYSVGPALLLAAGANITLALTRPSLAAALAAAAGVGVLALTFALQVPLHARLAEGFDPSAIAALNRNEPLRALLTYLQAAADVWLLARACA